MVCPTPQQLREALDAHPLLHMPALPGRTNHLKSAVLVPLIWKPEPVCVVTVRSLTLTKHAGEVCFPGGRPDEEDDDLLHTALREAHEELGIEHADILGELSSIPLYTSDYRLVPYVGAIEQTDFRPNPAEVAEVLEIEVRSVLEQPQVQGIPWSHEGMTTLSPVFEVGEHLMYGATAHSFWELLLVAAPLFDLPAPSLVKGPYTWPQVLAGRS